MLQNTERGLDSMQNGCKLQWIFSNLPGLLALSFSIGTVKSLQSVFKLKPAYYFSTKRETSHFLSSLVTVLEQVLWSYLVRRNTTHIDAHVMCLVFLGRTKYVIFTLIEIQSFQFWAHRILFGSLSLRSQPPFCFMELWMSTQLPRLGSGRERQT